MWKRIAIGVGVVVVAIVGWKLIRPLFRSDATKRLMAHHSQLRERIGDGLDALFDEQVSAGDNHVEFRGTFEIANELTGYTGAGCAAGFNAAFEDVLGKDVVVVDDPTFDTKGNPQLELTAKLTFGGSEFQTKNSQESFQSVALVGEIDLAGVKAHVDVKPPEKVSVSYTTYGSFSLYDRRGAEPDDIRKGIVAGTCQQAGYALLEAVTTWKRPAPEAPKDPVQACKDGFHCREAGNAFLETDPVKAASMYTHACVDAKDDEACLLAAALVRPGGNYSEAQVLLSIGCSGKRAAPCFAAGVATLVPRSGEITDYQRKEALGYLLRACDRGLADACEATVPLLEKTPFAEAAKLPITQKPVASRRFGTIFALRWGQLTQHDRGQATAWVTKRPQPLNPQTVIREFEIAELPAGITAPRGVTTVFAVALERQGESCARCNADQESRGMFMAPHDCVCALVSATAQ